ncbi:MAG: type I-B CRISPR-associated protein Cas8b/Csh1 [Lachnospiraceae bacterium]|nr:type I-B CRISPR-associated protein Cas8b/Csh1 [Lachnospiraceae bacterium]
MLKECLEVFEHELNQKKERLILDSYIPADGTYLIVDKEGNIKPAVEIKMDKKTRILDRTNPLFPQICFYDYQSRLISMNKPIDGKKVIHSNNYLSFWVKKDSIVSGKLKDGIIDNYYEILKDPKEQKYKKSKEASRIYELFEAAEGTVDTEAVEQKKQWIKEHIFSLDNVDLSRKDYLKIFFEADEELYKKEARRYLLPNVYNSNDYNVEIENMVYGQPDNNAGMNAKKPFLSIKSRKYSAPYVLNGKDVILQKQFFDYLMNFAAAGCYHIYVDTELKTIRGYRNDDAPKKVETGYYMRIQKGKNEAEILSQDNLPGYQRELTPPFEFKDLLHREKDKHLESYYTYHDRLELEHAISEVLFSNWLIANSFIDANDMSVTDSTVKQCILQARDIIFDWTHKGIDYGVAEMLEEVSLKLIKGAILSGYKERALWQLNMRWSFRDYFAEEGEKQMGEIISGVQKTVREKVLAESAVLTENDEEYYYTVGQLAAYLLSLSKAKEKNQSLINPLLNARTDQVVKNNIRQLYKKYNYCIPEYSKRIKKMLVMVDGYIPEGKVNQDMIILGYADDNIMFYKEEK